MASVASPQLPTYFAAIQDPRVRGRCDHRLLDVLVMAICAVIANCDDWQQIALFARERRDWFARFLPGLTDTPSHDTFERIFDRLDPQAFQAAFRRWIRAVSAALPLPHIAIDGKTLRRSGSKAAALGPLHLVSAWAAEAHLSLGQVAVADKSNEIPAIPQLLALLDIQGAIVTLDAMGCQKAIAQAIVAGEGEYVLTLKANQGHLLTDAQTCMAAALTAEEEGGPACERHTTTDVGHGRREYRQYIVTQQVSEIRNLADWPKLCTVGMCYSERTVNGKTTSETRYFISSVKVPAKRFGEVLRNHWRIENNLHWQLDVTFGEDANRVQSRHGAENLALIRRLAVSLLKQHPGKESLACKRLRASLNPAVLEEILRAPHNLHKL